MSASAALDPVTVGLSATLAVVLVILAIVDVRQMRIPDSCNACIVALGLVASAVLHHQSLSWSLISVLAGFAAMDLVRIGYLWLREAEGLGLGDVKFAAAAASWIGLERLPQMILLAAIIGLAWLLIVHGRSLTRTVRLPF